MKKLTLLVVAFATVPALAHAEGISLAIGNAIFSGLYSIGVSGAVANFVANSALGISAIGETKTGSFR